jgi:opacity protein-like surface antigen
MKKLLIVAALAFTLAPASARADWLFTPNIGANFGDSATGTHLTMGASLGWMGAGILGWEADFTYSPDFFEDEDGIDFDNDFLGDSAVSTFMGNVLVGIPVGGTAGTGFRPYATGGLGWLHTNMSAVEDLFEDESETDFGMNIGGGVMGFANDRVGFRGDLRYYRALTDPDSANSFNIDFNDFDFWRATGGVTFRW